MSREFGQYLGGCYFHSHVRFAADDTTEGTHPVTRLVGDILGPLADVADGISSFEAADAGYDAPVVELVRQTPKLREAMKAIDEYIKPFEAVARDAVERAAKAAGECAR